MGIVEAIIIVAIGAFSYTQAERAKKKARQAAERNKGLNYQTRETGAARRIIYGEARVGGEEIYLASTGDKNQFFHLFIYWGEGPNQSVTVQADGVELPIDGSGMVTGTKYAGKIRIRNHLGTLDQVADSVAVSEVSAWTTAHKGVGCCYSYIRLEYDDEVFANGMPAFSAIIEGRTDIYDPRSETSGYSQNLALCWAHYMSLARVGPNVAAAKINQAQLIAAANLCAESVALAGGGSEPRYSFDGVIFLDEDVESNIATFREAMAGDITYAGGQWYIFPGEFIVPTFEIDEDMIVGPVRMRTKVPRRDHINTVKGTYISAAENYQLTSFPPVQNSTWRTQDGEELADERIYGHTKSSSAVQRLSRIELYERRMARTVETTINAEGLRALAGRTVSFTFPLYGFDQTPMWVKQWEFGIDRGALVVRLTLKETAAANYAWDADENTATLGGSPTIYDPSSVPTPSDFTATPSNRQVLDSAGETTTFMNLAWDYTGSVYVERGQAYIRWKKTADATWGNPAVIGGEGKAYNVGGLDPATSYDFEVWLVTSLRARGASAAVTATTATWDGTFHTPVFTGVIGGGTYDDYIAD